MENLLLALGVVCPLFIELTLGYLLRRFHFWNDTTIAQMNNIVFRVFLPVYLFINVYHTELASAFQPGAIVFTLSVLLAAFLLLTLVVPRFEKDPRRTGVIRQGSFRANALLFGLPIALSIYGDAAAGIAAILIAFVVPLVNVLSVVTLEIYKGGRPDVKSIVLGIIKNPLIIGTLGGAVFLLLGIHIPQPVDKAITDISKISTPLALMLLGGSFQFSQIRGNVRQLVFSVASKLILVPALALPFAVLFGFRGVELTTIMSMLIPPTAVSSYTMADQMGGDGQLAAQIVVFGSAFSVITIFLWVFILRQLGLI